jgi:hypothetical protein
MKTNYVKVIMLVYSCLLIVAAFLYYTIPKKNFVVALTKEEIGRMQYNNEINLYGRILELTPQELEKAAIRLENWTFDIHSDSLQIVFTNTEEPVEVVRKDVDDSKIEVYWYSGALVYGLVNFRDQLKGPSINLVQNKLEIEYSKEEFSTTMFTKDSITKQFTSKNSDDYLNYGMHSGSRLFVKVPRGMSISGDERYIYINEETND